jgi:hypothetical protein
MRRGGARKWRHPQGPAEGLHRRAAWVGALAGAAVSLYSANQANRSQRGSGQVDITHEVNPYQGSMVYRDAGAAAAYNQMFGPGSSYNTTVPRGGPGPIPQPGPGVGLNGPNGGGPTPNPSPSTATGGNSQAKPPAGMRYNARGQLVRERNPSGGGGGGKPAQAPFQGQSTQTAAAVDNAMRTAADVETGQTTRAAQDYTAGTLRGEDSNAYRGETADMIRGMDDSDYRRYLDALFAADNGVTGGAGAPGSSGGNIGVRYVTGDYSTGSRGGAGGPAAPQSDLTGAAAELKRLMAGEDSPGAQAMRERIKRFADEGFNEQLRQRRLEAAGSGMYGGTGQLADEQFAQGRYGAGLADAYAQQDYDTYRQALGLGTAYDTAGLDRAAQERMNAANNATASAGISASAGAEASALASRERLARMEALGNAIGMGQNMQQFRASGMGSLAEGFSNDQRNALNASPDIATMGQSGWLNAGGLSLGSDQARNSWQGSQNQLAASRANVGLGRDQLAFDRERWAHDVPLTDIARYQSIISAAYDPFSSQRDFGYDRRAGQAPYQNVAGQTLAGAAAGYSLGRDIRSGG